MDVEERGMIILTLPGQNTTEADCGIGQDCQTTMNNIKFLNSATNPVSNYVLSAGRVL